MERIIKFSKFRNLGLKEDEKLVLNTSMEKGKIGNLIIVVGANNSGKSNVLDGLAEFGSGSLEERDATTLSYEEKDANPRITLKCKDNSKEYSYSVGIKKHCCDFPGKNNASRYEFSDDFESVKAMIEYFYERTQREGCSSSVVQYYQDVMVVLGKEDFSKFEKENKVIEFIKNVKTLNNYYVNRSIDYLASNYSGSFVDLFVSGVEKTINHKELINREFEKEYGMNFIPKILKYQNVTISNNDITTAFSNLANNKFFTSLFSKVGISIDTISKAYDIATKYNNLGALRTLETDLNNKLEVISKDFNNLYFADNDKYKFELRLESTKISFILLRGSKDILLDAQSTGFKWFFDLYFNLLCGNKLEAGDIIIMDEPATNLHVNGQKELRKFLKDFAVKNDILIVLATHSPFLIDLDYLDELRVISMTDNISTIKNDFHTIDPDDPDSLKSIKEALTVSNHILVDPDTKVVFVEGITDYNYLTAFKKLLKIDNIVFLPINGVGNIKEKGNKSKQTDISKELLRLRKHGATLLVDGDGAGKSMQVVNEESDLEVIKLTDIDINFKEIENVFDAEDLRNLGLVEKNGQYVKRAINSAIIKNYISNYKISNNSLANFKKIFDRLLED